MADAEKALQEQMDRYLSDKNPDGLHEIPSIATERGAHFRKALEATDQARSTYKGLVDTINRFEPRDDRWNPLRSAMKDTASRLYEFWDRKTQEVHRACDNIAKGTHAPAVEKFMSELGGKSQSDLKDFQDLATSWEKDARGIYVLDCQDMQRLWDAWCSVEFERNEDPGDDESAAERETDDIISRESSNIDGVLDRLRPLEETAQQLVQKAKYRSAVEEIQRMFDKQKGRLQRLKKKNGDWRGNNNPALQFTKTYGQQQHDKMNEQHHCNVYDQSGYPGLGKLRPDCVVVEGKGKCMIYEFKPKNVRVPNPLPQYVDKVQAYYTKNMHEGRAADSNLGGAAFQALVEANCRTNPNGDKSTDDIKFGSDVDPYERCDRRYECTE